MKKDSWFIKLLIICILSVVGGKLYVHFYNLEPELPTYVLLKDQLGLNMKTGRFIRVTGVTIPIKGIQIEPAIMEIEKNIFPAIGISLANMGGAEVTIVLDGVKNKVKLSNVYGHGVTKLTGFKLCSIEYQKQKLAILDSARGKLLFERMTLGMNTLKGQPVPHTFNPEEIDPMRKGFEKNNL